MGINPLLLRKKNKPNSGNIFVAHDTYRTIEELVKNGREEEAVLLKTQLTELKRQLGQYSLDLYSKFNDFTTQITEDLAKNIAKSDQESALALSKITDRIEQFKTVIDEHNKGISKKNDAEIKKLFKEYRQELETEITKILVSNISKFKGEPGEPGEPGKPGKNGSPDTAQQVVEKVNEAGGVQMAAIVGLNDALKNVQKATKGKGKWGGGGVSEAQVIEIIENTPVTVEVKDVFGITVDGSGSVLTTGTKGYRYIEQDCVINGWDLRSDISGDVVFDVKRNGVSLAGTEKPTLAAAAVAQDLSLTTWTTTLLAGDILEFTIDSVATLTRATLTIVITK
jgi:ribosome-binding protein aMBF1 (putative translation factor)